jgi:solute carrier family 10 (sodium/bile acid cotransporter), member 7
MLYRLRAFILQQSFILGILGAVLLAYLWPEGGRQDGLLPVQSLTRFGVFWIFLSTGLSLPLNELRQSLRQWPLHLFAQSWIFVASPFLMFLVLQVNPTPVAPGLESGLLFLSFLPCTISSALVLTTASGGRSSVALINSSLSNILCVFLAPLYVSFLLHTESAQTLSLGEMLQRLASLILLPLTLGMLLKPALSPLLPRLKPWFRPVNNGVICFIIFTAFSRSFAEGIFAQAGDAATLQAAVGAMLLLGLNGILVWFVSQKVTASRQERIALFFCGSQKALATGLPMAVSFFASDPAFGLIILPLMIYHPTQLILGALLRERFVIYSENGPSTRP